MHMLRVKTEEQATGDVCRCRCCYALLRANHDIVKIRVTGEWSGVRAVREESVRSVRDEGVEL